MAQWVECNIRHDVAARQRTPSPQHTAPNSDLDASAQTLLLSCALRRGRCYPTLPHCFPSKPSTGSITNVFECS